MMLLHLESLLLMGKDNQESIKIFSLKYEQEDQCTVN